MCKETKTEETRDSKASLDNAHTQIRYHTQQISLLTQRADRQESRMERMETRQQDQGAVLAEVQGRTTAIQQGMGAQHDLLVRTQMQTSDILSRLEKHIDAENKHDRDRTKAEEALHRTFIRMGTIFALLVSTAMILVEQKGLLSSFFSAVGW